MRAGWRLGLAAAVLWVAPLARAHELKCDKQVRTCEVAVTPTTAEVGTVEPACDEWRRFVVVSRYPTVIQWGYGIVNQATDLSSVVRDVKDAFRDGDEATLPWWVDTGGEGSCAVDDLRGYALPVGAKATAVSERVVLETFEQCRALANAWPPCGYGKKDAEPAGVVEQPGCDGDDVTCRRCEFPYRYGTVFIEDRLVVEFDRGESQCTARVICVPDFPYEE